MAAPITALIYGLLMMAASAMGTHLGLDAKVTGLFTLMALGAFGFQLGWTAHSDRG